MRQISLLIMTFLLGFLACKNLLNKNDERVQFQNNVNYDLYYFGSISYPDTINYKTSSCQVEYSVDKIFASSKSKMSFRRNWEDLFILNSYGVYMIYLYNNDSANYYFNLTGNCDSLINRKDLILKRFDVTLDYLNTHNWTLTYP